MSHDHMAALSQICPPSGARKIRLTDTVSWAIAILLVVTPLIPFRYVVLPDFLPVYFHAPIKFTLGGLSLLACLLWTWVRRRDLAGPLTDLALAKPVLAMLLVTVLSSMGGQEPSVSVAKALYYFLTGGCLFLIVVDFPFGKRATDLLVLGMVLPCYLVAVYGVAEFAAGTNVVFEKVFSAANPSYTAFVPDPWFGRRILSSIGHPVVLGCYLVFILPVSLSLSLTAPVRSAKVFYFVGTICVLTAIVLTFSRGAWLAAAVSLAVYLKLRGFRHLLVVFAGIGIVVSGLMIFSGAYELVVARIRETFNEYVLGLALTSRGQSFGYVAEMTREVQLLGLGTGMYRWAAYELRISQGHIPTPLGVLDTPDNMYLTWLAENGALGLCVALYLLACLFRLIWRAAETQTDSTARDRGRAFIAAFAGMCVDMLTFDALYFPVTRVIFWIAAGIAVVIVSRRSADDEIPGVVRDS